MKVIVRIITRIAATQEVTGKVRPQSVAKQLDDATKMPIIRRQLDA
jgi:hypothetical protein